MLSWGIRYQTQSLRKPRICTITAPCHKVSPYQQYLQDMQRRLVTLISSRFLLIQFQTQNALETLPHDGLSRTGAKCLVLTRKENQSSSTSFCFLGLDVVDGYHPKRANSSIHTCSRRSTLCFGLTRAWRSRTIQRKTHRGRQSSSRALLVRDVPTKYQLN